MFAFLFTISFKSPCESHPLAKIEVMAFSPKEVKSTTTSCTPETGKVKKTVLEFQKGDNIVLQAEQERLEMAAEQERRAEQDVEERLALERRRREGEGF